MKNMYENTLGDRNFLEDQLKKTKKINKILYLQQYNNKNGKEGLSDTSVASMLKKHQLELSEKSSSDKLMISEAEVSSTTKLKMPIAAHGRVKSFNLDISKAKSTPLSMKGK